MSSVSPHNQHHHSNPFKTRLDRANYPADFSQAFEGHGDVALIPPSPSAALTPPPMAAAATSSSSLSPSQQHRGGGGGGVHHHQYYGGAGGTTIITTADISSGSSGASSSASDETDVPHHQRSGFNSNYQQQQQSSSNMTGNSSSGGGGGDSQQQQQSGQQEEEETPPPSPIEKDDAGWHEADEVHRGTVTPSASPHRSKQQQQHQHQAVTPGGAGGHLGDHSIGALSPVTAGSPAVDQRAAEARHLLLFSPRKSQQHHPPHGSGLGQHHHHHGSPGAETNNMHGAPGGGPASPLPTRRAAEPVLSDSSLRKHQHQQQQEDYQQPLVGDADEQWENERAKSRSDTANRLHHKQRVQGVLRQLEAVLMRADSVDGGGSGSSASQQQQREDKAVIEGVAHTIRNLWEDNLPASSKQQQQTGGGLNTSYLDRFNSVDRDAAGDFCYYTPHLDAFSVSGTRYLGGAGSSTRYDRAPRFGGTVSSSLFGSGGVGAGAGGSSFRSVASHVDASIHGVAERRSGAFGGIGGAQPFHTMNHSASNLYDVLSPQTNAFSPVRRAAGGGGGLDSSPLGGGGSRYYLGGSSDPQRIDSFFSRSNIGASAYVFA